LLLDDADVDAVYIPLPNSEHAAWSVRALDAEKSVLVEKPGVRSPQEASELCRRAEAADRLLAEAYMFEYHDQWRYAQDWLSSALADGEPASLRARVGFTLSRSSPKSLLRLDPHLSGGALLDVGCYPMRAATSLFGLAVGGGYESYRAPEGVDVWTAGWLSFPGKRRAVLDADFLFPWTDSPLELRSRSGSLTLFDAFNPGDAAPLVLHSHPRGRERITIAPVPMHQRMVEDFSAHVVGGARSETARRHRELLRTTAANMHILIQNPTCVVR
jgi:predicted dehydrogenase